ncbi:hypothetical protein [[Eubacterium] cellulosolvens]
MEATFEIFRKEIDTICVQIDERIKKLGDEDIMTYRHDPEIKKLLKRVISLYRESVKACKTYTEAFKVCEIFKEYPECIKHLLLSEEFIEGIIPKEK